jgi:hypothetical protein
LRALRDVFDAELVAVPGRCDERELHRVLALFTWSTKLIAENESAKVIEGASERSRKRFAARGVTRRRTAGVVV